MRDHGRSSERGAATRAAVALTGVVGLVSVALSLLLATPASANTTTKNVPVSLLNAVGTIDIQVGDSLTFNVALSTVQITADLSGLPGGGPAGVLTSSKTLTFDSPGSYSFSWQIRKLLLGVPVGVPVPYVGHIVVAALPTSVHVVVPVPRKLPIPKVRVSVGVGLGKASSTPAARASTSTTAPSDPRQSGTPGRSSSSTSAEAGRPVKTGSTTAASGPSGTVKQAGSGDAAGAGGGGGFPAVNGGSGNDVTGTTGPATTRHLASQASSASGDSPSAEMPVLLAIAAVIALTLVAAGYVRLVLLRREAP
jgi:hypothetical protein